MVQSSKKQTVKFFYFFILLLFLLITLELLAVVNLIKNSNPNDAKTNTVLNQQISNHCDKELL